MAIEITCPECQSVYKVADHAKGKSVRCQNCDNVFVSDGYPVGESQPEFDEDLRAGVRLMNVDEWNYKVQSQLDSTYEFSTPNRAIRSPVWVWLVMGVAFMIPVAFTGLVVIWVQALG